MFMRGICTKIHHIDLDQPVLDTDVKRE